LNYDVNRKVHMAAAPARENITPKALSDLAMNRLRLETKTAITQVIRSLRGALGVPENESSSGVP
jgi:hypothetical protein